MFNRNHPLHFESVLAHLKARRENVKAELRAPATHDAALELKRQLDAAIDCLEFCQRHQIHPHCRVTVLPPTRTQTPSSEYRIMEDHESENREHWTELAIGEQAVRPSQGDILLSDVAS